MLEAKGENPDGDRSMASTLPDSEIIVRKKTENKLWNTRGSTCTGRRGRVPAVSRQTEDATGLESHVGVSDHRRYEEGLGIFFDFLEGAL
jgi:hypothetical protein